MTRSGVAEQALAFVWAIQLKFPAADRLLEDWASQKILKPEALLIELSDILGTSTQERDQALLRLAHDASPQAAVSFLVSTFEVGLEIEGNSFNCTDVFYNLEHFIRSSDNSSLPRLPLDHGRAEVIFKYYGLKGGNWDAMPIRPAESCGAIVELLRGLKLESRQA